MNKVLFYILCVCFILKCVVGEELSRNAKLNAYLEKKTEAVLETFSENLKTDVAIEEKASIDHVHGTYRCVFSLFNESFIFLDNQVYRLQTRNDTIHLSTFKELSIKSNIAFTKITQFEDLGFILIKTEVQIDIYGLSNGDIFFIHSILAPHASDAHFFVNQKSLYLIVINSKEDEFMLVSSIYKWLGTHFDEKKIILTSGATKVTSFSYNFFEIIIVSRYSPKRELLSTVFEFNFEKIKKIQHIKSTKPVSLQVYHTKVAKYVLIFEESKNNLIYEWDGSKLVLISQFQTETIVNKSVILTTNNSSILAVPATAQIQLFSLLSKNMKLIGESNSNLNSLKILDIHKGENMPNIIYVVGLSEDTLHIRKLRVVAHIKNTVNHIKPEDSLQDCFNNLESDIYSQKNKLKEIHHILMQTRIDLNKESTENMHRIAENESVNSLNDLKNKLEKLEQFLNSYENNKTIIYPNIIVNGSIEAEKLSGKNVNIKILNGQNWKPQHWLKYKENQNIIGQVKVNKITVRNLHTSALDTLFTDILTKNEDQVIHGKFEIVNLTAAKIITEKINGIPMKDIYIKSNMEPIHGLKTFENLKTAKAKIELLNEKPLSENMSLFPSNSAPNVRIFNNLKVENLVADDIINDIQLDKFKASVFRIGITKEINGNITLPEFSAHNITLKTIKGVRVEDLLTTSTYQTIDADIEFVNIFAGNITTNTTNDIDLSKSAVQFENNTIVDGPVKFNTLYVRGNLELIGKLDKEFFLRDGEHIVGTNESDLFQSYAGVVNIKGNLYVKNITLNSNTELIVGGEKFDPNLRNVYWTKTTNQIIPTHFEALNGISVPHLMLNKLNNINFTQYMGNKDEDRFKTSYHFKDVSILGNVFLNATGNHIPNLTKLNHEAVKTNGSYYITGKKIYTDTLRTENLEASVIDGITVNETFTAESTTNGTGQKVFKNVIIKGNLSCNVESIQFINGFNVSNLLNNTIYIDEPSNIEKLHFKNISVEDLWVTKLNNQNVNQHIENVEKMFTSSKINSLKVTGNVALGNVTGVSKINNIQFDELLNRTYKRGKDGSIFINLNFLNPIKVNNLITSNVNDINLKKFIRRVLYRDIDQNVTATYTFQNIKTENLIVNKINNVSTEDLISVTTMRPQTIYAPKGVELSSAILQKSLNVTETSPCNLVTALKALTNPPTQTWSNIQVKGNVSLLDSNNILYRVFEETVTTNTKNVIRSPVKFSTHVMATNVFTNGRINDVNVTEIVEDAVLTEFQGEQVITGRKIFPTLRISSRTTVLKNADIPVVNKVDIPELNQVIVRKNDSNEYVIKGNKTFYSGLQCDSYYSDTVSNISVDNIVSTKKLRKVPSAIFDTFEVEDSLNISSINSFDFEGFLKTRLLTQGGDQIVNGVYYFDNIEVEHMEAPSINNITMNNVVFDIGQQNISSPKRFTQEVDVFGNLTCAFVNGISISDLYKKSIQDHDTINGNMTILRPSLVNGNITTTYINDYPIEQIKQTLNQGIITSETEKIYHIKNNIADRIKHNIHHIKFLASDYMYIEKTQALQILVPNIRSATTMESGGYVLIHVNGEESGQKCGLPDQCKCPVQYSIQISPENSVATFPNKGSQRIFTYNDDSILVNFLTNSVSTNTDCRRKSSKVINEVSLMTWNTLPVVNTTAGFYQYDKYITGYISGAEFFTLHGQTYAIIGRYYDPTINSHDLECYLIKFSHDKSKAEEIQKIPTKGAWSIYLFHTAQGVTLVVGNINNINSHQTDETTEIYRFNENSQKFDLLRTVPSYGCSMATGVVLGHDSLIVLAHRYAPPQVLKYYPYGDNYYFYQSFELEAPVVGISVFYTGGFGISDAYLCTVTANENYFIYSFRFIEGWKLESTGELEGLRNLIPFELNKQSYLFAPSSKFSSLLTVVKHGSV